MAKPRGLGKGLDLMIPNVVGEEKEKKEPKVVINEEKEQGETLVKITKVEPNREQPRKYFDEEVYLPAAGLSAADLFSGRALFPTQHADSQRNGHRRLLRLPGRVQRILSAG